MNLEVLAFIVDSAPEKIEELAGSEKVDSAASIGVAKALIGNGGNVEALSAKQKFHYENCIAPLIENVACDGVIGYHEDGSDTCSGNGYIDEESLLASYMEDDFKCQLCRYDSEKIASE